MAKKTKEEILLELKQEEINLISTKSNEEVDIEYLETKLISIEELLEMFSNGTLSPCPGQRTPDCMNTELTDRIFSTVEDGKSLTIPEIQVAKLGDLNLVYDGLQRITTLQNIKNNRWDVIYTEPINYTKKKIRVCFSELNKQSQEKFLKSKIKVSYSRYPNIDSVVEAMYRINISSTTMTYGERELMYVDKEIIKFIEKFDEKAKYKLSTVFNFNKNYNGRSDRGALKVFAIECFLMAAYSDELKNYSGSISKFLKENKHTMTKTRFTKAKKLYKDIMNIMFAIAINNCNCQITRYRALWFALCMAYENDLLGEISSNQVQVAALMQGGEIWDKTDLAGKGATSTFPKLRTVYQNLVELNFSKISKNWIETVEIEVNKEDLLPTTKVTTEESAS